MKASTYLNPLNFGLGCCWFPVVRNVQISDPGASVSQIPRIFQPGIGGLVLTPTAFLYVNVASVVSRPGGSDTGAVHPDHVEGSALRLRSLQLICNTLALRGTA